MLLRGNNWDWWCHKRRKKVKIEEVKIASFINSGVSIMIYDNFIVFEER